MTTTETIADEYLTGCQQGWHAIHPDALKYVAIQSRGVRIAKAECGKLVRVSKYGPWKRAAVPVAHDPCPECAWKVALETGAAEEELALIGPGDDTPALERHGLDPFLAMNLCRAILATEGDRDEQAIVRQLAAVTAHRPALAVSEACNEGQCVHRPDDADDAWTCGYPDGQPLCWACTLQCGDEAGEWAGMAMTECMVSAPCSVLAALAHHWLPGRAA